MGQKSNGVLFASIAAVGTGAFLGGCQTANRNAPHIDAFTSIETVDVKKDAETGEMAPVSNANGALILYKTNETSNVLATFKDDSGRTIWVSGEGNAENFQRVSDRTSKLGTFSRATQATILNATKVRGDVNPLLNYALGNVVVSGVFAKGKILPSLDGTTVVNFENFTVVPEDKSQAVADQMKAASVRRRANER